MDFPAHREMINPEDFRSLVASIRHVSGPEEIRQKSLVVACTVRNGMGHLPEFVRHYQQLSGGEGVDFVFLDNGSTDGTIEFCRQVPRATVLQSEASYKKHYIAMSQYLLERFGRTGWVLLADADEHFDFAGSNEIGILGLLRYLDRYGYNAMPVQMLDMFPEGEITRMPGEVAGFAQIHNHFDISQIQRIGYRYGDSNQISNSRIPFNAGGIRRKIFGLERTILTKHPLLNYRDPKVSLVDPHSVKQARIADISGVFFHYKFTPGFPAYVKESVELGNHWHESQEYKEYLRVLNEAPELNLMTETAVRFRDISQLLKLGLLHETKNYQDFRLASSRELHRHQDIP